MQVLPACADDVRSLKKYENPTSGPFLEKSRPFGALLINLTMSKTESVCGFFTIISWSN